MFIERRSNMYAWLTVFTLEPGMRSTAEKLCDQFTPVLQELKGFKGATLFGDEAAGKYGGLSLWESKEDAEAALAKAGPKLEEALSSITQRAPGRRIFEVLKELPSA